MKNPNTKINNYYEDALTLCDDLNGNLPMNPVLIITKKNGLFFSSDLYDNSDYDGCVVAYESEYIDIIEIGLGINYNTETDKYELKELTSKSDIAQYNEDVQYWIDNF